MQAVNSILNTNTQYQYPSSKKLNTNIDIDDKNQKKHIDIDPRAVEYKATELLQKLGSPSSSLEFFCSAFYKLPEATVYRLAGLANEPQVRNKGAYFNVLVRRELSKQGAR